MNDLSRLTARQASAKIAAGQLTSEMLVRACLARIDARESAIKAWAWIDPRHALQLARERDRSPSLGPLHGIPIAVKDVIDTCDMPTSYNSPHYIGHRPSRDAAIISLMRSAGAVILGKTETVEFAAGGRLAPTRNPHNLAHTPGGSSSGSGAAVADFMAPLALGTQSGGSVLRPASFCGVYAMKPTWNVVSCEGIKTGSLTLDTIGWYGREVDDLKLVAEAVGALLEAIPPSPPVRGLNLAACRTPMWGHAEPASQAAFEEAITRLRRSGAHIDLLDLPATFSRLPEAASTILFAEGRPAMLAEYRNYGSSMHPDLVARVENRKGYTPSQICAALDLGAACRSEFDHIAARYDGILVPSAVGEAPRDLTTTGDSIFQRMWTLLHVPSINIPGFTGPSGLPIGLTLVSGRYKDARLLAAAQSVATIIDDNPGEARLP